MHQKWFPEELSYLIGICWFHKVMYLAGPVKSRNNAMFYLSSYSQYGMLNQQMGFFSAGGSHREKQLKQSFPSLGCSRD